MRVRAWCHVFWGLILLLVVAVSPAYAGTIQVDVMDPACVTGAQPDPYAVVYCSIQDAIDEAAPGDSILIAAGNYDENLVISIDIDLLGAGELVTVVRGDGTWTAVEVTGGVVSISDVTIRSGAASYHGGGIYNSADLTLSNCLITDNEDSYSGGGIFNQLDAVLEMHDCTIRGNRLTDASGGQGGGIYNHGTLTMDLSQVTENAIAGSDANGGGLHNAYGGVVTITNSSINENEFLAPVDGYGVGISNMGTLNLTDSQVFGNIANGSANGGGIHNNADATISGSVIDQNNINGGRGGGMDHSCCTLHISDTAIAGNQAQGSSADGGGLYIAEAADLTNVTISGNLAGDQGGGIRSQDQVDLVNVTISGNIAAQAGGIYHSGAALLGITNSTITDNTITSVSGVGGLYTFADVALRNTILSNNEEANCGQGGSGSIGSLGHNLEDGDTCGFDHAGDQINTDPKLGSLQDNGGRTHTHALLAGSPAIDAGDNIPCPGADQRDVTRPIDGDESPPAVCDVGAYEREAPIFADVGWDYWARDSIEAIYHAGITSGCDLAPLRYCPTSPVSRAQMAKFLLVAKHGSSYSPPPGTGSMFTDVPPGHLFVDWIEQLANEGITSGCAPDLYCPDLPVSRAQMAKFLLLAEHGSGYTPPASTGSMFADVGLGHLFVDWIEQLANEGITSGCGGGNYCPDLAVARDQMAVFLGRTFDIQVPPPSDAPATFDIYITADMRSFSGPGTYDTSQYYRGALEAIKSLSGGRLHISPGDLDPVENPYWTHSHVLNMFWYPVVGNHELPGQGTEDYPGANMDWLRSYDTSIGPGVIADVGPSGCPETTFSFDVENVHVVLLNEYCDVGGDTVTDGDIPDHLYDWLVSDLSGTSKEHIFVFGHEPAFPQPDMDNGRERHMLDSLNLHLSNRNRFWDLLQVEGVDFYGCGHTHNYSAVKNKGVWQLDAGHARGLGDPNAKSTFLRVRIYGGHVWFEVYREETSGGAYTLMHRGIVN